MVYPKSPTTTEIRDITSQKLAVAPTLAFLSTLVCKTSKRSGVFQDS